MRIYDDSDEQGSRYYFYHNCIGCNRKLLVIMENNTAFVDSDYDNCVCGESFQFLDDIIADLEGT